MPGVIFYVVIGPQRRRLHVTARPFPDLSGLRFRNKVDQVSDVRLRIELAIFERAQPGDNFETDSINGPLPASFSARDNRLLNRIQWTNNN